MSADRFDGYANSWLLGNTNTGEIDAENAKRMIGDHYDMSLYKQDARSRTQCGHIDQDDGMAGANQGHPPFFP